MSQLPKQQEHGPKRVTWGLIWGDFLNVINFERGVLLTIKGLFLHPKRTVDDYLYGNRPIHANPLRFLLFSTAIVTLLNFYLILKPTVDNGDYKVTGSGLTFDVNKGLGKSINLDFSNIDSTKSDTSVVKKDLENRIDEADQRKVLNESLRNLFSWMDKFTFALVPIFAIFTFLFFRSAGYNFTENLVIIAFMVSMTNVMGIVLIVPTFLSPTIGGSISSLTTLVYTIIYINKVFAINGFAGWIKTFVATILSYFLYVIVVGSFLIYFVFDSLDHL
ncbi:MAG: DUF3667 domain-containing protein [Salibacteraceae bacterium]